MQLLHAKLGMVLLFLLAASCASAENYNVTVGGTSSGDYGDYTLTTFVPAQLTIQVGDTVTFHNAGGFHNVAADDGSFRCAQGCDGAGGNGAPSDDGWTSTVTFNEAGTFGYHCDVHAAMGMTGSITVQGAGGGGNVPITGGFTGTWYDPDQSGHGIFLEVLPNNLILAWWFAFNPDGTEQVWFGDVGAIVGDTATVQAKMRTGGRWIPNFDPGATTNEPWGTLTFTFSDCSHGRVEFDATASGYGTGSMDLQRLTQPVGVTCP